jgi:hypothetical protein
MIMHIVMWNVSGVTADDKRRNIELVRNRFEDLHGNVPGLLHLEIGVNRSASTANSSPGDVACLRKPSRASRAPARARAR